jgi:hypothetical protein
MRNALLCIPLFLIAGCGEPYRQKQADTQEFIESSIPIGTRRGTVLTTLRLREVGFQVIPRAECEDFVIDPRFTCMGGSAILVIHDSALWSWRSPSYRPSLRSFLAFDDDERLADYTIFLQGGH